LSRLSIGELCSTLRKPSRFAAHALRRRVGRGELRMLRLERMQVPHQRVVLGVTDLRLVQNVIEMFVAPQLFAELFDFASGIHPRSPL